VGFYALVPNVLPLALFYGGRLLDIPSASRPA
jgi:hypothetical protein